MALTARSVENARTGADRWCRPLDRPLVQTAGAAHKKTARANPDG
jgi:hypothetical protein